MNVTVDIMPGAWICGKCGFILDKKILSVGDGEIYADTSPLNEHCPNDNQLMRPMTWREVNETMFKLYMDKLEEIKPLQAQLKIAVEALALMSGASETPACVGCALLAEIALAAIKSSGKEAASTPR